MHAETGPGTLLEADEPGAFELIPASGPRPVVVACDHASHRIPERLGSLGVSRRYLRSHIAWDIGAGAVARALARRLGASAVLGGYSRLVVDLNRHLADTSAFPAISDGVLIPANIGLSDAAKAERAASLYAPYHRAIAAALEQASSAESSPVLIAVHSFTPRLHRFQRPWHIGVLWDKDPSLAVPLMAALRRGGDLVVGDNEPYSGRHPADYTIDHHAEPLYLAHVSIEIRQDLVAETEGARRMAERLAAALEPLLTPELAAPRRRWRP